MITRTILLCVSLVTATLSALQSKAQCPGNIHSLHASFIEHSLIVVPIRINGASPNDFLVDTGTLITIVDPALALELQLKAQASIGVTAVATTERAALGGLDTLAVESYQIQKPLFITHDLTQLQRAHPRIRGILGQNFLNHFDVLIDYTHKLLCLDETRLMRQNLRGEHIPLVKPQNPETDFPFAQPLLIAVHLPDATARQTLLRLDSGSNTPLFYAGKQDSPAWIPNRPTVSAHVVGTAEQSFAMLPPQDMRIGKRSLNQISFVTPLKKGSNPSRLEEDGLLPTAIFNRIYLSYGEQYVIVAPQ
jgi:gag-polyprotein putative aspartyl protease